MPLYEYQCGKCGHRFEKIQSFSAEPIKECPVCGGPTERLISAPAVQFKGSGFYSTDYGSKPSRKPASSEGGSKSGSEKSTGSADFGASASSDSAKTESKNSTAASKPTSD